MRHMMASTHHLLKDAGTLLIELPWMNQMGKAFQANGNIDSMADNMKLAVKAQTNSAVAKKHTSSVGRFQDAYKTLISLYFIDMVEEKGIGDVTTIIASKPREVIPDIKEVFYNPSRQELNLKGKALEIAREAKEKHAESEEVVSQPLPRPDLLKQLLSQAPNQFGQNGPEGDSLAFIRR